MNEDFAFETSRLATKDNGIAPRFGHLLVAMEIILKWLPCKAERALSERGQNWREQIGLGQVSVEGEFV